MNCPAHSLYLIESTLGQTNPEKCWKTKLLKDLLLKSAINLLCFALPSIPGPRAPCPPYSRAKQIRFVGKIQNGRQRASWNYYSTSPYLRTITFLALEAQFDLLFEYLMEGQFVVKEGWAVKESGQAVLGQTNWRKRWCQLVRGSQGTFWSYYRYHRLHNKLCCKQVLIFNESWKFTEITSKTTSFIFMSTW